jgi:hypothetical protein
MRGIRETIAKVAANRQAVNRAAGKMWLRVRVNEQTGWKSKANAMKLKECGIKQPATVS